MLMYVVGLAADVGTNQRMPKIIGNMSLFNELAFTCRQLPAQEAKECGLVNRIYQNKEKCVVFVLFIHCFNK